MKHLNPFKIIVLVCMLCTGQYAHAQLDSCNVFLQGSHIEVGINFNGAYGSSVFPSITGYCGTGYHSSPGIGKVANSGASGCPSTTCSNTQYGLGFVSDPDKDGWGVGTPWPFIGDYFLPGTPQEGWSIMADGVQVDNFNGWGCTTASIYGTGNGTNLRYNTSGRFAEGIWQGTWDSLQITQRTILDTTKVFFTIYVSLVNTANVTTRNNVYYQRTLDPDNTAVDSAGSYVTANKIDYQLPNAQNRVLVSAIGELGSTPVPKAYLGLGTLDCRAKAYIIHVGGLFPPNTPSGGGSEYMDSLYGAWGSSSGIGEGATAGGDTVNLKMHQGETETNDQGIGLVFKLGNIAPHDSVAFAMAYILRQGDIDSAFLSTKPKWTDFGDTLTYLSGDTAPVCKNSLIPLNIVNGGYLSWTWYALTGNYMSATTGTAVNVLIDSTQAIFMAVGSSPSCANDTLRIIVTPNLAPKPIVVSPVYYCQLGTPDTLKAIGPNLKWYTSNPSDPGSSTPPLPSTDTPAVYTYYVTSTVRDCESDRVPIVVIVNPPPPVLEASNNGALCLNETMQLNATTITGSQYYWSGPNGFTSRLQNPFKNNVVAADSGLYTVVDSLHGCPTQVATTNVLVDNLFAKIGKAKNSVCTGDTLTFNFAGHAPDTNSYFTWTFDNGIMVQGDATGKSKGPYIIRFDTSGTRYIKLTAQNWRCISTVIDTLPVHTAPDVRFNMPKDICIHDTITVLVAEYSLQNANNLAWDFGGGANVISGDKVSGAYHISYNTSGKKSVFLTATYPWCIRQPYGYDVDVHELPNANIVSAGHGDVCEGDTVSFTADVYPNYIYTWGPPKYVGKVSKDGGTALITIPQSSNVYIAVRDQYNCKNTDTMFVNAKVCCTVSFPSAFTPNGDGRNDMFKPITIGHHHVKHFKVVNRYGQVVFESNDENKGWDGTLFGVPQDMDTYFYVFTYNCNGRELENKGDVILVR